MIRSFFTNLYFLVFLNGFLIASLLYSKMEAGYEEEVFQTIRLGVDQTSCLRDAPDSLFVRVTHVCHELMMQRRRMFGGTVLPQIQSGLFQPVSIDLMTANGGCGSFAFVLARLLKGYGYPVRIAQMKVNGVFAAHNIVEVQSGRGWVVLDGMFDLSFRKPGRGLASFADVQHNWAYYSHQLPKGYNPEYRYEDVRYSNWSQIPFLMPGIKSILDLTLGRQQADSICIRSYILSSYQFAYLVLSVLTLIIFPITVLIWFRKSAFNRHSISLKKILNSIGYSKKSKRGNEYAHKSDQLSPSFFKKYRNNPRVGAIPRTETSNKSKQPAYEISSP